MIRFSICPKRSSRSCSTSRSGPSTVISTTSASWAASVEIAVRCSPSTSPRPGVSTSVTFSNPGQGVSVRRTVVPPLASVANTSRPAKAFSSDDLPLEIVPNATISSFWVSRLSSKRSTSGSSSPRTSSATVPVRLQIRDRRQILVDLLLLLFLRQLAGALALLLAFFPFPPRMAPQLPDRPDGADHQQQGPRADRGQVHVSPGLSQFQGPAVVSR